MYQTNMYEGMLAETTTIHGANGDSIHAYFARPLGAGPFPSMVLMDAMAPEGPISPALSPPAWDSVGSQLQRSGPNRFMSRRTKLPC